MGGVVWIDRFQIKSKFSDVTLNIDRLSTGCKTACNIRCFPDKVFCIKEYGENALEEIYKLDWGNVYSDYATIPFEMKCVQAVSKGKKQLIEGYESLKEWWEHEE